MEIQLLVFFNEFWTHWILRRLVVWNTFLFFGCFTSFRKRNEKSLEFWQDTIMLNGNHRECCDQHWSCSTPCSRSIFETSLGDRSKLFTFSIFPGKTFSQLHTFSKHQTVIVWIWMHCFPFWTKSANDVHIHDSQHFHK